MADNSGTGSNGVCVTFKDCEDAIQNCPSSAPPPPPPSCDTKDSVYFSVPFMQKVTKCKLFFLINFLSFIHIFCSVVDGLMSIYMYVCAVDGGDFGDIFYDIRGMCSGGGESEQ